MNAKISAASRFASSSRRNWLKTFGLAGAGLLGARFVCGAAAAAPVAGAPRRSLRFAHITDIHLEPERGAHAGFVKCLHHLQSQADAPTLIVNTGDCIMDSMQQPAPRTRLQWDLWHKTLRDECSLPIEHTIGNHDCWGLNHAKSGTTGQEARWGKQWALAGLGLKTPYRSFDRNGWHFIVLDSVEPYENSYKARLGTEQLVWLKQDLAAVPPGVPILVLSHIPIISPGGLLNDAKETETHDLNVAGGLMHLDAREIHTLFRQQGNVKLCLSGHLHILDRATYDGVTYLSPGAVCSGWWKNVHLGRFDYGYALVDLFADGSFTHEYVTYGWQTVPGADRENEPAVKTTSALPTVRKANS